MQKYDRDLRVLRWLMWWVLGSNLFLGARFAYVHQWLQAAGDWMWVLNCGVFILYIRAEQHTRDAARLVAAMLAAIEREREASK